MASLTPRDTLAYRVRGYRTKVLMDPDAAVRTSMPPSVWVAIDTLIRAVQACDRSRQAIARAQQTIRNSKGIHAFGGAVFQGASGTESVLVAAPDRRLPLLSLPRLFPHF